MSQANYSSNLSLDRSVFTSVNKPKQVIDLIKPFFFFRAKEFKEFLGDLDLGH